VDGDSAHGQRSRPRSGLLTGPTLSFSGACHCSSRRSISTAADTVTAAPVQTSRQQRQVSPTLLSASRRTSFDDDQPKVCARTMICASFSVDLCSRNQSCSSSTCSCRLQHFMPCLRSTCCPGCSPSLQDGHVLRWSETASHRAAHGQRSCSGSGSFNGFCAFVARRLPLQQSTQHYDSSSPRQSCCSSSRLRPTVWRISWRRPRDDHALKWVSAACEPEP
jgi:hypothetical protein